MNNTLKTVLGVMLTIALSAAIFFEFKFGFNMIASRKVAETDTFINQALAYGRSLVTFDELSIYDEMPTPEEEGDVIRLKETNVRVKINGELPNNQSEALNFYTYKSLTTNISDTITMEERTSGIADMRNAVNSFWHDEPEEVLVAYGLSFDSNEMEYLQQSYKTGNIPVAHNTRTGMYYMFLDCDKTFIVVSCKEPFVVTDGIVTARYGDPSKDIMKNHTYSEYEELAAENTRRELLDKDKKEDDTENPYKSGDVVGTPETYTAKADNQKRDAIANYGKFDWKADGTSKDTTKKIDTISNEAKKSEWVLTATTYSYTTAGLTLSNLSAKRSSSEFTLSGNINNTLDAERPYVIAVKFMGENGELLKVKVIDNRNKPLDKKGVATFETTVTAEQDKVDTSKIFAVQFEVY